MEHKAPICITLLHTIHLNKTIKHQFSKQGIFITQKLVSVLFIQWTKNEFVTFETFNRLTDVGSAPDGKQAELNRGMSGSSLLEGTKIVNSSRPTTTSQVI